MVIVMKAGASQEQIAHVVNRIKELEYTPHIIAGVERTVIGAVGDERGKGILTTLETLDGVENVVPILKPYKLASSEIKKERTVIRVGKTGVEIGGGRLCVMAGPCSVEGEAQILEVAHAVKAAGAHMLRGGAYKPRTSPYSFQGMEEKGLKLLAKAREATGLPFITEVMDTSQVDLVEEYADIVQIGTRNVQNFALLKRVGKCRKPVFLKRGLSTTISEWLMSAEYILSEGNPDVILCERGIRTFETATRNTMDLSAVPVLNELTHLPVILDPSHGTGVRRWVPPMAFASVAAGADGLMIEVHNDPDRAWSDGPQSLDLPMFSDLMTRLKGYASAAGRSL
ncbi:MAG: 3-deoxy-7-phosphoheptulonate synthase [Nitrospirota bacterium]|nr:3-deoxy-7-phosphoheptulonate synthase [Nitrospirota bacterium]